MGIVLQSDGLSMSEPSFTDDAADGIQSPEEDADLVKQVVFTPVGRENPRPHLLVSFLVESISEGLGITSLWSIECVRSTTSIHPRCIYTIPTFPLCPVPESLHSTITTILVISTSIHHHPIHKY